MARRGSELDRWARVLGVGTDDEAIAVLKKLSGRVRALGVSTGRVASVVADCPDGEVASAARDAFEELAQLAAELEMVRRKFEAHVRGDQ